MLKNSLYVTVFYFFISLFAATSANAQIDSNAPDFNFFGSNPTDSTGRDGLTDQSPLITSVAFTNTDIADIFQIIRDRTQWSIFPTSEVSRAKISLYAHDITAKNLLDTVVQMAGFIYHKEGNIITVMTYDEYSQFFGLEKKIVSLRYGDAESIRSVVEKFISNKIGKIIVHEQTNSIIIFETDANLETIIKIIKELDIPAEGKTIIKVFSIEYIDAEEVANTLREVFTEEKTSNPIKITPRKDSENKQGERITSTDSADSLVSSPSSKVVVNSIGRTNQLIVKASRNDIEDINDLIMQLDVYVEPTAQVYSFTYVDAAEIYQGLDQILDISNRMRNYGTSRGGQTSPVGGMPGGTTLIEQTNSILVTAPPSIHRIMETIRKNVDVPSSYETGEIRTYKLNNADVNEVAATIRELLETSDETQESLQQPQFVSEPQQNQQNQQNQPEAEAPSFGETEKFIPKIKPKVAVNAATNSIIIQATSRQQAELAKLIAELDRRRNQVYIRPLIVEVSAKDDTDFGVELDYINRDTVNFTSFGLSTLNPSTGARDIIMSTGGTAAILNPNKFQTIIKALQGKDNVKIESAPQILVNDNAIGVIQSIAEQPTKQTNQGNTSTTTSFGQYVTAGTQIAVSPHISDNNCLRVEYEITLNSFGEQADLELPPARNTSYYNSFATVPDGSTIILGGIKSANEGKSVDKVPLIGDIPLIGLLFRNTVVRKQYITTYLFITTSIMKDENFNDLKDLSQEASNRIMRDNKDDPTRNPEIKTDP